jgi:DNA-binding XRE family transcriptional regulator
MGAWGYAAYENDTAGDWVFKNVVPHLRGTIGSPRTDTHETLVALAVACDLSLVRWLDPGEIDAAFEAIDEDDENAGWSDLDARRRYVRALRHRVRKALESPTRFWSPVDAIGGKPSVKKQPSTKPNRIPQSKAPALAANLRACRKARSLSANELAEKLDVTPAYVRLIESGDRVPSRRLLKAIAAFFGHPVEDFVSAKVKP